MKKSRFSHLLEALPIPCLLLRYEDSSFIVEDANDAFLKNTGTSLEELVGKPVHEQFPKNPQKGKVDLLAYESFEKVVKTLKPDSVGRLRYDIPCRKTGEFVEKYWSVENSPVLDDEGKLEYVLHSVQDITAQVLTEKKRREIQEQLTRDQQQYQHFVESNPDGLYSLDLNGRFLSANQGLADMAGVSLNELLNMNFMSFCAEEDLEEVMSFFQHALSGRPVKFESPFYTVKGQEKILEVSLVPIRQEDKVLGAYGIAKDITGMKLSEKILVEKRNFLKANATLIGTLLENELEEKSLMEAFAVIGKAVTVDRMYYYNILRDEGNDPLFINARIEWASESTTSGKKHLSFSDIPKEFVEEITQALHTEQYYSVNLSEIQEEEVKRLFRSYEMKSMLLLPIFLKEELYGVVGFDDCTRERQWSEEEVNFLKNLSYNLTTSLEKRHAEAAVKEQEEALRLSEQKFRALIQEGSDLVGIIDLEGKYLFVSETAASILGLEMETMIGHYALDRIHPEDREKVGQKLLELQEVERVKTGAFRFLDGYGNWRWLETTATNLTHDPAVQGVVVNSRDVSTHIQQAREIEQISERYQLAAAATQDLLYDWDLVNDEVVRFHQNMPDVFGHSLKEASKNEFWNKNVHPAELEKLNRQLLRDLGDKTRDITYSEYRFRRADGSYAHIIDRGYIIRDAEGKAIRIVGASSDVSDLNAKTEALSIANTRFELAMKATNEMIWDWNIDTGKVDRSSSFETMFGYARGNSLQAAYWFSRLVEDDRERVQSSLEKALENPEQENWQEEYRIVKGDGETAYIIDRGFIIRDREGKAIRMVGSALDVTDSRKAMERIEHQNKLLREIAWEQSHVVRAPLARLKGLLQLFELQPRIEMDLNQILQHMNASADELDNIVRGIVIRAGALGGKENEK